MLRLRLMRGGGWGWGWDHRERFGVDCHEDTLRGQIRQLREPRENTGPPSEKRSLASGPFNAAHSQTAAVYPVEAAKTGRSTSGGDRRDYSLQFQRGKCKPLATGKAKESA